MTICNYSSPNLSFLLITFFFQLVHWITKKKVRESRLHALERSSESFLPPDHVFSMPSQQREAGPDL